MVAHELVELFVWVQLPVASQKIIEKRRSVFEVYFFEVDTGGERRRRYTRRAKRMLVAESGSGRKEHGDYAIVTNSQ